MRTGRRKITAAATVMLAFLLLSLVPGTLQTKAQSTQTCTPSTCEQIYPAIPYVGVAPVQQNPQPPVFAGAMYVANTGSNTVSVIQNMQNVGNVSVGPSPLEPAVDTDNGYVYVPNSGGETVSILSGTAVEATVNVGSVPLTPAFDPANGFVYVPNSGGCSVASGSSSQCGDTISVISGTDVIDNITVGEGPATPAVYTGGGPYFGYVYVPNTVVDSSDQGTVTIIAPNDTVVGTVELGNSPPNGAFFDHVNDYVYVGPYVFNGLQEITEMGAGCDFRCALDPFTGNIYLPSSQQFFLISGTTATAIFCQVCGAATFNPMNGFVYMDWAVSGTTPFATTVGGIHDVNSYNPNNGYVYSSCGGCYYVPNSGGGERFGNVVFATGDSCDVPGAGYYYNATNAAICNGSGAPTITNQTMTVYNGNTHLPEAIGNHSFFVQLGSLNMVSGDWIATSSAGSIQFLTPAKVSFTVTGPNGTTGWATIKIDKKLLALYLWSELGSSLSPGAAEQVAAALNNPPELYVDGEPVQGVFVSRDSNSLYISFQVHFSTHNVTLLFDPNPLNNTSSTHTTTTSSSASSTIASTPAQGSTSQSSTATGSQPTTSNTGGGLALANSYLWLLVVETAIAALLTASLVLRRRLALRRSHLPRERPQEEP